jgi:hypothetical protein
MLTVPTSNHLRDTASATGDVTVPDVTWWGCLVCYAAVQADDKKYRKKRLNQCISHLSGNVGFALVTVWFANFEIDWLGLVAAVTSQIGEIELRADT